MQTAERLEELLTEKDAKLESKNMEIEKLQSEVAQLESTIRFGVDWMMQRRLEENPYPNLPVPRIQLEVFPDEDRQYQENEASLVVKQRDGAVSVIPLSYSKTSGGKTDITSFPTQGSVNAHLINRLPNSALSDVCHFAEQTGIPAFVVLDESRLYRITQMRPVLEMETVQQ